MAKNEKNMNENVDEKLSLPEAKTSSAINPKIFLIGLPLFIIQLIVVYFVTANILLNKGTNANPVIDPSGFEVVEESPEETEETKKLDSVEVGKHILNVDDMIVNPAGTKGQRIMLVSMGFDLASEEELKTLESKNVILKDLIISTLSKKTLAELSNYSFRDTLKIELSSNVSSMFPEVKVNNVYFSKYIIQ
ncbi:MAG: flagellar basal body protein FliL [Ignavibacteriae bacterium]|nr:flagellar basal body protein FliL [Ignavibacteriota bacterium]